MAVDFEMSEEEWKKFLNEPSKELDSWLNKDYLNQIAEEIVNLNDYVPSIIESLLPDPGARKRYVVANVDLRESDYFLDKQILDQSTIWEDYVTLYDDFFDKHPEFSKLIKSKEVYNKWRTEGDFC